jgi:hypothetical protein
MTTIYSPVAENIADVLPTEIIMLKRWLLWKAEAQSGKKPRKVPYYIDGSRRSGPLGSEKDLSLLATFSDVLREYQKHPNQYTGIGLALIESDGVGAVDMDQCVVKRRLDKNNLPAVKALKLVMKAGCYIEYSPSGSGVRVVGYTAGFDTITSPVEAYCKKRFVTFTGQAIKNERSWKSIDHVVAGLERKSTQRLQSANPSKKCKKTPETEENVKRVGFALNKIDPNIIYNDWIKVIFALKSTEWVCAENMARTWSAGGDPKIPKAAKYDPAEFNKLWDDAKPDGGVRLGTLFDMAKMTDWEKPKKIKGTLPPVDPFDPRALPPQISAYVMDVAEQMSCPPEFPAIGAMVCLASAIGSRVFCRPEPQQPWTVPAGAWGMVVGPPGQLKSPPIAEMLRPLQMMEKDLLNQFRSAKEQYDIDLKVYEHKLNKDIKKGINNSGIPKPIAPEMTRYLVNDTTYEMLIQIAHANPAGFLVSRDELSGWFHSLKKENQKEARGVYLTGWSGTQGYATDRIGRGHVRAERLNISLLGTIQPNVLRRIVYDAVTGGVGDDGLVQRFQFAVYPDPVAKFKKAERPSDNSAQTNYANLIKELINIDPVAIGATAAETDEPYLVFSETAQLIFDEWREKLEERLRDPDSDEPPEMLAHLGKYRSLFPKIALVLHLADGQQGDIGERYAKLAQWWTQFLEKHARRIYNTATDTKIRSAVSLSKKLEAGQLDDAFTRSIVLQKDWADLRQADELTAALDVLTDKHWIKPEEDCNTGGRHAQRFYINPQIQIDRRTGS